PTGSGIGGDLFALVYVAKEDKLYGLNASGWSPKAMTPDFVRSKGAADKMPQRGPSTVTVPGVVAGWDALRKRFGALPFSMSLAPAIFHAENGFPLMEITAGLWTRSEKLLGEHPNSRATFLVDGRAPGAGQIFRIPTSRAPCGALRNKGATATTRVPPRRPSWTSSTSRAARWRSTTLPISSPSGCSRSRPTTAAGRSARFLPTRRASPPWRC